MKKTECCGVCGGLAIDGACPNCAAGARPANPQSRWFRIATAVAAAGTAVTLAACYGPPPNYPDSSLPDANTTDAGNDAAAPSDASSGD
ncbi:MAG: hypothetical protein JNK05_33040 [Myxococcales bacterium]|nr:hypothetical protein [Myxococcales bacterium]